MNISEEQLRTLVLRILGELAAEKQQKPQTKIYMVCAHDWDERYAAYLEGMEQQTDCCVHPVVPLSWKNNEHTARLESSKACGEIVYRSCKPPADLDQAITVFPVVARDVVAKAALCISDTFETSWIASCMEAGGRLVFLRSGLTKFSGKEPAAYTEQILSYYRKILSYGILIQEDLQVGSLPEPEAPSALPVGGTAAPNTARKEKKRVITSANIDRYAVDGVLHLQKGDILTDLAKDKAKFLKIQIK